MMGVTGEGDAYDKNEGLCILTSTDAEKTMTVEIDEPPTPEWKIAFDQNFSPDRKTVFLNLGAVNGEKVLRFANQFHRVNLLAKYEPEY